MKRSRLKRRTALKAKKGLARGTARLNRGKRLKTKKKLKKRNRERAARLEARDYGPKAVWARTLDCYVTRRPAPSVAAHPDSRGAGGHSAQIVPFNELVEIDWHQMPDAVFEAKYGRSKQDCRDAAPLYEAEWQRMLAEWTAAPFIATWEDETGLVWGEPAVLQP